MRDHRTADQRTGGPGAWGTGGPTHSGFCEGTGARRTAHGARTGGPTHSGPAFEGTRGPGDRPTPHNSKHYWRIGGPAFGARTPLMHGAAARSRAGWFLWFSGFLISKLLKSQLYNLG